MYYRERSVVFFERIRLFLCYKGDVFMKVIILAGGGGTRLFPLSRHCFPKQFLKIEGQHSLLAHTIKRFMKFVKATDIVVVTNQEYLYLVQNELESCNAQDSHIIIEPVARNTAPAIALAIKFCQEILVCKEEECLFVAPADHVIKSMELFSNCLKQAEELVQKGQLVTFGIHPISPETGYGYLEVGEKQGAGYYVSAFKEKPDLQVAKAYIEQGNYYWNSGMFVFSMALIQEEFSHYQPQIAEQLEQPYQTMIQNFHNLPNISIDHAIAEQSQRVSMIPLTCYWNDIGSWDAIYDIMPKDSQGNAILGDCLVLDCHNSLFMGRDRLIAGIGLDDLLLVETDDVIVVSKKGESQRVKEVVNELKNLGRKEAVEHTTLYRSWGTATLLGEGQGYRMKKVTVRPGAKLSFQMHYHRSEHWIVLSGTAKVELGENIMMIHENESVFIPQTVKHRLANPGKIPLIIIEVQNGNYLSEDDIVRFD